MYAVNFQRLSAYINWDNNALTAQYYKELKDLIKNEISCTDWLNSLHTMIKKSIIINNWAYERKLEKQHYILISQRKSMKVQNMQYNNKLYYRPQLMKINVAFHQN